MKTLAAILTFGALSLFAQNIDYSRIRSGPGLSVISYGADPSGTRDSSAAFNSAISGACSAGTLPKCGTVFIPDGTYLIAGTVTIPTNSGIHFIGDTFGVKLIWTGDSSSPLLSVQSCFSCRIGNFQIQVTSAHPLLYGIQSLNSTVTPRYTGTQTVYSHIFMEGTDGSLTTGIYWGPGTDANNDQSRIEDVAINNYKHSGFTLNNTQVVDIIFNHDVCASFGQGAYCVEGLKGTYQWTNGDSQGNYVSDFLVSNTGKGNTLIDSGSYEGSSAFITTLGPAYTYSNISVRNVNFSGECIGATQGQLLSHFSSGTVCPPTGGPVITYKYSGTLAVQDSSFGIGLLTNGVTAAYTIVMQNFGGGFPSFGSFNNVAFVSNTNTTVSTIFPNAKPTNISSFWTDGAVSYLPLELHPVVPIVGATTTTWTVNSATQTTGLTLLNQTTTNNSSPTTVTTFSTPTVAGQMLEVYVNDSNTTWQKSTGAGKIQFEGGGGTSAAVAGKMYVFIALGVGDVWLLINK